MAGYERGLRAAGSPVDPSLVVEGNFLPSGGREATLILNKGEIAVLTLSSAPTT